jgi:hypothetical protein
MSAGSRWASLWAARVRPSPGNVVAFALDGEQRGALNRRGIDDIVAMHEQATRQQVFLEHRRRSTETSSHPHRPLFRSQSRIIGHAAMMPVAAPISDGQKTQWKRRVSLAAAFASLRPGQSSTYPREGLARPCTNRRNSAPRPMPTPSLANAGATAAAPQRSSSASDLLVEVQESNTPNLYRPVDPLTLPHQCQGIVPIR